MNVVVDGLMTDYQKIGSGKVIVCLPGWGNSLTSFANLAQHLQGDYTILTLDLPGFGSTEAPPTAWGLENHVDFVAEWLKKIGVKKIHSLVGHSYGGAVAITGLSSGIIKSEKLVLIASAGIRSENAKRLALLKAVTKIGKQPLKLMPKNWQTRARQKFYGAIGSDLTLLPHMEATFRKMINQDVQSAAASIKVPTLLIYGSADQVTPLRFGRLLNQAINGSKLEIISGAGHFVHQEQAEKVAGLIKAFLEAK